MLMYVYITHMYPCNQHPNQDIEHFHHPRKFPHPLWSESSLTATLGSYRFDFYRQRIIFPVLELHISAIIHYVLLI